jgi:serpin B
VNRITLVLLIPALGIINREVRAMELADSTSALVQGNTAFALDLYGKISRGEGNQFFSPFSISCALAMTYAGAQEQTAVEMARTLHFKLPPAELHTSFLRLIAELPGRNTGPSAPDKALAVELLTANALWSQSGERILPEFQKRIETDYQGALYPVDFRASAQAARRTINTWVEEQTKGKIRDLLKPEHIDSQTLLVLTNAIYFKALWAIPFSKSNTAPGDFHVSAAETVRAELMNLSDRFRYFEEAAAQVLELPYQGQSLAMDIFLPKAKNSLSQLEASLNPRKLEAWLSKLAPRRVQVSLPRFKLTAEADLKGTLSALGMPIAFELGKADFSGMTGTRDFAISAVVHKAFIEVEEKGTEAAAATGVVMTRTAAMPMPPVLFRADHPFFFLIRDSRTGNILFMGRLTKP